MQKDPNKPDIYSIITDKINYLLGSLAINSLPFISILIVCGCILPKYIEMFKASGISLPIAARVLFQLSYFVTTYWFLYIIVSIFIILLLTGLFAFLYIKEWISNKIILIIHAAISVGISILIILLFCFVVYIPAMDLKRAISLLI